MIDLTGVNAVVTGSTRGLGRSFAAALHNAGASVVLNGRTEAACRSAVEAIDPTGTRLGYVAGGVENEEVADALIDLCTTTFGDVGLVINNAGITKDKSLLKMSVADFDAVVSVHLRGTWLMCRAAARAMRSTGGSILNLTSGSALYGLVGQSNYAAAKAGVLGLTRALSVELERYSIRVNALYPIARTEMTAPVVDLAGPESELASVFGEPDDVAAIVPLFLRSEISGQVLSFDGKTLGVWSHPGCRYDAMVPMPGDVVGLRTLAELVASHTATLHPDRVGVLTRAALRPR
ncbi:SDR family NAD(P)-dependent oxidoreductase [Nocardia sp. R7R-8]|uniref:SDR family NAD(P)-dependent oxidoreductase n=1 Tax=Nocardia sp. R7R-8 TaxID=3459304 RepID=UPI00403DE94F